MRCVKTLAIAAAIVGLGASAHAELQNVEVGGSIRIRANYYSFDSAYISRFNDVDDIGNIEQRSRLNFKADFTDQVSLFVELDAYNNWGDNFRSNYFSGADAFNGTDIALYQSYIQADEMWGTPLRLRVGRQELSFGSEWLVGVNDASSGFAGLSFDALRLDYITDEFNVAAFVSLLANNPGPNDYDFDRAFRFGDLFPWSRSFADRNTADGFMEDETAFAGIYGSYTGLEDIVIDAYWFGLWDQDNSLPLASLGGYAGLYGVAPGTLAEVINPGFWRIWNRPGGPNAGSFTDATTIHTLGLRGAGTWNALDFEAEVAYQFGDIELVNRRTLLGFINWDLDSNVDYENFAANAALGYTFDSAWTPRVGLAAAYFGGAESSAHNNNGPFNRFYNFDYQDEMSFNRLFSNYEYSEFLENTELSNALLISANLGVAPTEATAVSAYVTYFLSNEEPDYGWWWNAWNDTDDHLGWEIGLAASYNYSEDLVFRAGWAMFLAGEGFNYKSERGWPFRWRNPLNDRPGNFSAFNGTRATGFGEDGDNYHYVYAETELSF